jgi:hypothetical protein
MTSTQPALKPGTQLASTTCSTKVVVVRAPGDRRPAIACGGAEMVPVTPGGTPAPKGPAATDPATLIGKRYVDADGTLELLCTASGAGELSADGEPMSLKAAKALPASD